MEQKDVLPAVAAGDKPCVELSFSTESVGRLHTPGLGLARVDTAELPQRCTLPQHSATFFDPHPAITGCFRSSMIDTARPQPSNPVTLGVQPMT